MSNLPISSKYRSTPDVAVDDAEREEVTSRLNEAFAAGSLDEDAYRRMLDVTYAAKTLGELAPVVENLPALSTHSQPAAVVQHTSVPVGEVNTPNAAANRRLRNASVYAVLGGLALVAVIIVIVVILL